MNKKGFMTGVALVIVLAVLPASAAVVSSTGDLVEITYMDLGPDVSVQMDAFESNNEVFLLKEQEAFAVLDAPALDVDHLVDSDLADETNELNTGFFTLFSELTSGTIAENTEVNSYLLHFDTVGDTQARVTASVTFDEQILGLILTETELEESDDVYGQEFVLYPEDTVDTVETNRGLELEGADNDWFVISQDARTLTFSFVSKNKFDQVRIITWDAADGPPLATNCSGFSDAELDIIPGNRDNTLFADSNSGITVALFSTENFDATSCLVLTNDTLTFGRTGDEMSFQTCGFEDFDNDGFEDLICDFSAATANFQVGDTEGILRARLKQVEIEHLQKLPMDMPFILEYSDDVTVMETNSQSVSTTTVKAQKIGRNIIFAVEAAQADQIELEIYNAHGVLIHKQNSASGKLLRWNMQNESGRTISNGVYFYVVKTQVGETITSRTIKKLAVIR